MDAKVSGRLAKQLDVLHALSYFAPEVDERIVATGVRTGRAPYFAGRSAPFGRVGPGVVAATFYVFNPAMVTKVVTGLWDSASPEQVVEARFDGVDAAFRRLLGDDIETSAEVAEAAELVRAACSGCSPEGRALYAAHADLDWPEQPHLALFHGLSLLREHRGDGHVAALQHHGLSGIEAQISHVASGRGFTPEAARATRAWSEEEWAAGEAGLAARGILTADGELTDSGHALRKQIEDDTNRLGAAPWETLGDDRAARLAELALPLVERALANGAFPGGIFA